MLIAIFWISTLSLETTYADLWVPTAIMGFGIGLALTPMNLAAMNAVSRDHAGAASGILVTLSGLGATLGVAVTGAIFGELQTERTVDVVGERGVDGRPRPGAGARGRALRDARRQARRSTSSPGTTSAGVEHAVREAFVSALGTSLKISAALVLVGIVLAVVLLRKSEPADAEADRRARALGHPAPGARAAGTATEPAAGTAPEPQSERRPVSRGSLRTSA